MKESFVLITGGAGYIGMHAIIQLYKAGYKVIALDNLVNCSEGINELKDDHLPESIRRVRKLVGEDFEFYKVNLLNREALKSVFEKHTISCVVHVAGLKAVGESMEKPLEYYHNNVTGSIILFEVMKEFNVKSIIFSSSATVYGIPKYLPLDEKHATGECTNPYGRTKYFIENILQDLSRSDSEWSVVILRYFNPVGAHESGMIGEDPFGKPNNLMPFVAQVAVGRLPELQVFGNDFDTKDGTGVRDYIHVVDLAEGHVNAIKRLSSGCKIYNLGTGIGYSVLDMVNAMEKASGKKIPYAIVDRRPGDTDSLNADGKLAEQELGWKATKNLDDMCADLWRWQQQNPRGFLTS